MTIQYSSGIKHQFSDFIAGQFSLYSKDIYDLIAATQVTDAETGNTLQRYINKAYASARGVEVSLEKRLSNHWQFEVAYTFAYADGVASSTEFGGNPEGLEFLPSQELPLDWDQRHTLSVQLFVEVDDSSNRMQKKIKLAQDQKIPYMLVLGDREVEGRTAAPRTRRPGASP